MLLPLLFGVLALLLAAIGVMAGKASGKAQERARFFQKGVNFTAERPGGYGSPSAQRILRQLPRYGVTAVALVPYGFTPRGQPRVVWRDHGGREADRGLQALAEQAHAQGMKVLLKPQIWMRGGSPSELDFGSVAARRQWFDQYRRYLDHYARLAAQVHADVFCVGVEFVRLAPYTREWRELIAQVRTIYSGPLVYAANSGPEFERITFWDALDYIGLDEYYPLPDDLSTATLVATVERVQQKFKKPVLFTEAGFPSLRNAHRQPWNDRLPGPVSLAEQARCYQALLQAFYRRPWFAGVYWWKVGTNGMGGPQDRSHTPWGKPAMEVMARWYLHGGR